jgi:branched-chain amino acid aminotransferase
VTEYVYLKDAFVPTAQALVRVDDRSFRFGDGLFETLLVYAGRIYNFAEHRQRLERGLCYFHLTLDTLPLENLVEQAIEKNRLHTGYVRVIVSAGENSAGMVGYARGESRPYLVIQTLEKPLPTLRGMRLWHSNIPATQRAPCKTNSALTNVLAHRQALANDCDTALLCTAQGIVCESASATLFWVQDGILYTPSDTLPLVPGTMGGRVKALWPGQWRSGEFPLEAMAAAECVFLASTGGLIMAVETIQPHGWSYKVTDAFIMIREKILRDIKAL